jgi:hypothetical protein
MKMATPKDRVVDGTQGLKKIRVIKATGNNVQKIRCPGCKELANPAPDGKGGQVINCRYCNRTFRFQRM